MFRYAEVYDEKGNLTAYEPYEVSDKELEQEQLTNTLEAYCSHTGRSLNNTGLTLIVRCIVQYLGLEGGVELSEE